MTTPNVARFQDANGNWLEADKWPKVRHVVTCHTPTCRQNGKPLTVDIPENVDGVFRAQCGPCGQPHTDMRPA